LIEQYFQSLLALIARLPFVQSPDISLEIRGEMVGFIRGTVEFKDGSFLHFRELVDLRAPLRRVAYAYHYQKADGTLAFRYDNTAHHVDLSTFPHHKHVSRGGAIPARPPDLESVLEEIESLLA
jgi:hypothetical protein